MQLKTLLVCLTSPEHAETLLRLAVPLARRSNAHVIGLHTIDSMGVPPAVSMYIPDSLQREFKDAQKQRADGIKDVFRKHTQGESFQSELRLVQTPGDIANDRIVESARAADLVIMSAEDPEADRVDNRNPQVQVIRESGRPVIVVPLGYDGPEIGHKILLGWSDTREAARAAHDLLILCDDDTQVTVLRVGNPAKDALEDSDAIDLTETLSRHGLDATLEIRAPVGDGIADVLGQVAFEGGADLIATGALGHSRVYDFVIGATTYKLLRDAKLPVMFSK
ncbi:MAG: universal stress protein [Silicimonas sp.]|nr:universal stress protein [Silicimonas sp.]